MTPEQSSDWLQGVFSGIPVIPVLTIQRAGDAEPLAEALAAGGLPVLEVTLRTGDALESLRRMAVRDNIVVGAGTLLTPKDAESAKAAGARFGVSPGSTPELIAACAALDLPLLPGAATASETVALLNQGFRLQKFFPAEPAGGCAALKALAGPLPDVRFCPTGGITARSAATYLALANVTCVGGSWIADTASVRSGRWSDIQARAQAAASLGSAVEQ
ncbi:MAG: bifunctional 4-hydroxy-2-oxoglutarate aldolase/2-dehydro-3-deoxy-phosphogluconate aldolase [Rhodobacteraceae bacterium]|nr:bifunctional 4-hydroxy-2-oxoglutarate aldolase/2-dehydro-3-deoxy-phosphogluconate aldolase [Paracoccaceae bacterium]